MNGARHTNKIALVTGGAQGIGAGIVKVLYEEGASVVIVDRQKEKAEELAKSLIGPGQEVIVIACDISTRDGCKTVLEAVSDKLGSLDILVNNAAPGRDKSQIGQLEGSDWDIHSSLVLQAVAWLSELAHPYLRQSVEPAIVNVSSVTASSIAPAQCSWPYHVSKSGLEQLTRFLACKLGADNIRVNAVAPGLVDREEGMKISDTPKNRQIIEAVVPLRRAASAREIGKTVSFLCSDDASYLTGQTITVDGGMGVREVFGASLDAVDNS
ncbi:MAG: SDR family oxidoreductase [Proteobacteria bacterium]|nr:SDR family oxidoreductase [Pseudomonadota bacterium]